MIEMLMTNHKESRLPFDVWFFFAFFAFSFLGFNGEITNYIKFALFCVWILSVVFSRRNASNLFAKKEVALLMAFLLFFFLTSLLNGDLLNTIKWTLMYLMQFGAIFAFFSYKSENPQVINKIKNVCLLIITIVSINASLFYVFNPNAARSLAADSSSFDNIAIGNGYSLAYSLAIVSVYILYCLVNGVLKKRRLLYVCLLVLFSLTIYLTESTTTLIALLLGFLATIMSRIIFGKSLQKHTKPRIVFGIIIIVVLIIAFLVLLSSIGNLFVAITSDNLSDLYARRLNRIGEKLVSFGTGNNIDNYVDERLSTITLSLRTFFQNPLFGVGYRYGNIYSYGYNYGVGQHSEFADLLAQFGIFGMLTLLAIYLIFIGKCNTRKFNLGIIVTIFILCIFNPFMSFQGCYIVLFFVPLAANILENKNEI